MPATSTAPAIRKVSDLPEKYRESVSTMLSAAREKGQKAAQVESTRGVGRVAKYAAAGAVVGEMSMHSLGNIGGMDIPASVLAPILYVGADAFMGGEPPRAGPARALYEGIEAVADVSTAFVTAGLWTVGREKLRAAWAAKNQTPPAA